MIVRKVGNAGRGYQSLIGYPGVVPGAHWLRLQSLPYNLLVQAEVSLPVYGIHILRGHPFMTSALREGGGVENRQILQTNSTDGLREMQTKGGGGDI